MLADIIANYLTISPVNASYILKLLSYEKHWEAVNLEELNTQADFITLLNNISQKVWFKGHDRALLSDVVLETSRRAHYYELFQGIGLTKAIRYPANMASPYYSVLFGSAESKVKARVEFLQNDLMRGIIPLSEQLYILSCNRGLGISVPEREAQSRHTLQKLNRDLTEMNMTLLILDTVLVHPQEAELPSLTFIPVEIVSTSITRQDKNYVKTSDTVVAFKNVLDKISAKKTNDKPRIIAYSSQPHILRQQQDMQQILGDEYDVFGVGSELKWEAFNSNLNSISNCCGEISRLIYLNQASLTTRPEFNALLTAVEQRELVTLQRETA